MPPHTHHTHVPHQRFEDVGPNDEKHIELDALGPDTHEEHHEPDEHHKLSEAELAEIEHRRRVIFGSFVGAVVIIILIFTVGGSSLFGIHYNVPGSFVVLSDIRLDLDYQSTALSGSPSLCRQANASANFSPLGRLGCETPASLLRSALLSIQQAPTDISFLLITGGLSADHVEDARGTLRNVEGSLAIIREVFPTLPVVVSLGATDVNPRFVSSPSALTSLARLFSAYNITFNSTTFVQSGFSSASFHPLRILSLNSLLYATNNPIWRAPSAASFNSNGYGSVSTANQSQSVFAPSSASGDPEGQLAWLRTELVSAQALRQRSIILAHVPPMLNTYTKEANWVANFSIGFKAALASLPYQPFHGSTSSATLYPQLIFGFLHESALRLFSLDVPSAIPNAPKTLPLHLTPALSPVFNTNPAYRIVHFDRASGELLDFEDVVLDLQSPLNSTASISQTASWWITSYSSNRLYNLANLAASTLSDLWQRILASGVSSASSTPSSPSAPARPRTLLESFCFYRHGMLNTNEQTDCCLTCPRAHSCLFTSSEPAQYQDCLKA